MNGPALLALQLVDVHLDQLDGRRKRLPERVALDATQTAHAAWRAERDRQVAIVDAATASIEQAEHAGAAIDVKKTRLEGQLKTIIAPREAEALMHEIALLDAKHAELDDVELAAMEEQSDAESALAALGETEPALLEGVAAAQADLDAALAVLADETATAAAQRVEAVAALAEAELARYDALRARHRGMGIASLERHTCTGCHVDLSQVEFESVVSAPAGDLPECPHCGRLLVV